MTWRDISPKTGRIKVIQQKTGVKIEVPLHRDLLVVLEKARHNHVSILVTEWGKPFTVDGFSGFMPRRRWSPSASSIWTTATDSSILTLG